MTSPIVEISNGKLKGKVCKTANEIQFYTFKGIPYAKPPVGDLRFSVPLPPDPWDGVRDATKDCNICAQFDIESKTFSGDEDCLYLNVYTPKLPTQESDLLPVMFFIHGGGFLYGSGTDDAKHAPDFLVEKDVVIVSFNYRVGILGFLSLDLKEAPGNMGLRDQVQALKWVKQNISKFGGDPDNVSLLGFSAGAASAEYLLLSPMAKGLFHKAILHSGSSLLHWANNNKIKDLALKIPVLKGKFITDNECLLKYLKELSTKELVVLSVTILMAENSKGRIKFGYVPTIEKPIDWEPFIDKASYQALKSGEFTKVPIITGFCDREGLLTLAHKRETIDAIVTEKKLVDFMPFDLDETEKVKLKTKLLQIYLESDNKFDEPDSFAIDYFSDLDFIGGIYVAAKLLAKHSSPVYFYEFSYDGALNYLKNKLNMTDKKGACHGDDSGYLIKCGILPNNVPEKDNLVRQRMVEMWTNFVKCGNPTPTVDNIITTKWEPIADTGISCLVIDENLTMKYEVYPERMKLFEHLYERYHGFQ